MDQFFKQLRDFTKDPVATLSNNRRFANNLKTMSTSNVHPFNAAQKKPPTGLGNAITGTIGSIQKLPCWEELKDLAASVDFDINPDGSIDQVIVDLHDQIQAQKDSNVPLDKQIDYKKFMRYVFSRSNRTHTPWIR
jgi:hypothetical protein